jgi:hypothetical protein
MNHKGLELSVLALILFIWRTNRAKSLCMCEMPVLLSLSIKLRTPTQR